MLIYLTDLKQMPNWSKEETALDTIFHYEVTKGYSDIHSLRLFGLYKDESRDIRHNVYHPMDYVSHDVKIVIGEFDCIEKPKPNNSHVVKEIDRAGSTSILKVDFPVLSNKHKGYHQDEYIDEVFEKLKKDERILFCYVTPSGKGIRFGFKVDSRIHNDLEYISNYYFYGKQFLKYDTRGRLDLDFNASETGSFYELANITSVYWFLPNTDKWHVRESVELKKI